MGLVMKFDIIWWWLGVAWVDSTNLNHHIRPARSRILSSPSPHAPSPFARCAPLMVPWQRLRMGSSTVEKTTVFGMFTSRWILQKWDIHGKKNTVTREYKNLMIWFCHVLSKLLADSLLKELMMNLAIWGGIQFSDKPTMNLCHTRRG